MPCRQDRRTCQTKKRFGRSRDGRELDKIEKSSKVIASGIVDLRQSYVG